MQLVWKFLHPRMTIEHLGFIPEMLNFADPDSATKQLDKGYQHAGGWNPFDGFRLRDDNSIVYPGDPPLKPLAVTKLREETIYFYDHAWVLVMQPDRSFEVCRMD